MAFASGRASAARSSARPCPNRGAAPAPGPRRRRIVITHYIYIYIYIYMIVHTIPRNTAPAPGPLARSWEDAFEDSARLAETRLAQHSSNYSITVFNGLNIAIKIP